ncbi:hypothetical protein [Candidatus Hamiltonella defensa]|uniref:hypothetical protein n=1 Tax=Candidatus Williamhamiltonella defendens TaxID=138072 RepID=UPI0015814EB8|nr:hypothetical protein [Candidatus Hamiltonella defensa]
MEESQPPVINRDSGYEIVSQNIKNILNKKPDFTVIVDTEKVKEDCIRSIQDNLKSEKFLSVLKRECSDLSDEEIKLILSKQINVISIEKNPLDFIDNNDKIYILGHGSAGRKGIYVTPKKGEKYCYHTDNIVDVLSKSGLSQSHISFKLLPCHSADSKPLELLDPSEEAYSRASEPFEKIVKGKDTTVTVKPLAHHFSESLNKKGFCNAKVTGYHGSVQRLPFKGTDGLYHSGVLGNEDYDSKRRSEHKEIFNFSGRLKSSQVNTPENEAGPSGYHHNEANTSTSATESTPTPGTSTAAMGNSAGTSAHQNTAAISNATAHAALTSSSSEVELDNLFQPLSENNDTSKPVSTEESRKEKAEKALENIKNEDTNTRLRESRTLRQLNETQTTPRNEGTDFERPTESLEPHQPVAKPDVSEVLDLMLRELRENKSAFRYKNFAKNLAFLSQFATADEIVSIFYNKDFVKEFVHEAQKVSPLCRYPSEYDRQKLALFNMACDVVAELAETGKLPEEGYRVWCNKEKLWSPTYCIKQHIKNLGINLKAFLKIAKRADFPSSGFKSHQECLKYIDKDLEKKQEKMDRRLSNIKKQLQALGQRQRDSVKTVDLDSPAEKKDILSYVRTTMEKLANEAEELERTDEDLGEALDSQRQRDAINAHNDNQKQNQRRAQSMQSFSYFSQGNKIQAEQSHHERRLRDAQTQHQKKIDYQLYDHERALQTKIIDFRTSSLAIDTERNLAIEMSDKKHRLEQEQKQYHQLGQTPAPTAIGQSEEHPPTDMQLNGFKNNPPEGVPVNHSGLPNAGNPHTLPETNSHDSAPRTAPINDGGLANDAEMNSIGTRSSGEKTAYLRFPGATFTPHGNKNNVVGINMPIQIPNNQGGMDTGSVSLDVKPEEGKTVIYVNDNPIESTSYETETQAHQPFQRPQPPTLVDFRTNADGIGAHFRSTDGSEVQTALSWPSFDGLKIQNYDSQETISINTFAITQKPSKKLI